MTFKFEDAYPTRGGDDRIVHSFETRSCDELIEHLEHWLARCSVWVIEGR